MRRVQQVLLSFIIVAISLVGLSSSPHTRAQSIEELRKKREQLSREVERNRKAAQEKKQEADRLAGQIKQIDQDISATQSRIEATQAQIDDAIKTIDILNSKIAEKQRELDEAKARQNEALRVIYETTEQNFVFLVAGSTLSDAVDRAAYLEALEATIEKTIEEIKALKIELQTQKKEQEDRQGQLEQLKRKHEAYQRGLDGSKKRKNQLLGNAKQAQKDFEQKFAQAKQRSAEVEAQISALARASAKRGGLIKSKDLGTSEVGFIWPMDYDYTTTEFGPTDSSYPFWPAILHHAGLDIRNQACGTPVYAAADGTTNLFGVNYGYGNYIVVGHNARFSTLYGHLESFAVSDGEEVKRGQVIGYEGNTGWSTGCHVHFEVWDNGERKNPRLYLP